MTRAAWLAPLPDAAQMRALDAWAIGEQDIASLDLMERAGLGLTSVADDVLADSPVAIICGSGNNGGDGYVAARLWLEHGRAVRVLSVGAPKSPDARANAARLPDGVCETFAPRGLEGVGLVVDALLGTGASGAPTGAHEAAIDAMNASGAAIVSADIPSGVDASSGETPGAAVRATATATFAASKAGLWIAPGKQHAGVVHVIDIGVPRGAPIDPEIGLITAAVLNTLPVRTSTSTKFSSGRVSIAGASRGLTGAVCLAAQAAARAGAGYVTALVPTTLENIFEIKLTEQMTVGLPEDAGALGPKAAAVVVEKAERGALVLGPGAGSEAGAFVRDVAAAATVPLVLDADGLNAHAGKLATLADRGAPTILTPHAGELARLLETEPEAIAARRLHHARLAARVADAIVVLKGDDTIVATPDGRAAISAGGCPALATAGTGDVLSGTIGALLAGGAEPFLAACAGVFIHAEAGRLAARRVGSAGGVTASDVIECLPRAAVRTSAG
ncbi:MAG TPA: NAD(P)H-hydrate dehydratase [Baekduia sp.]|nr:NAD(P)H-hydrate dehydratase [Baekduia sp.]